LDAGRQILRYSIPGALLLLHGLLLYLILRACQGTPVSETSSTIGDHVGPVVAVLATIPIGFLVYQVYHFNYSPFVRAVPGHWGGRLVRLDRGAEVLRQLPDEQIADLRLIFDPSLDVKEAHQPARTAKLIREPRRAVEYRLKMLVLPDSWPWEGATRDQREAEYGKRWLKNWDVLRAIVDIAGTSPATTGLKQEYTTLSDVYHALGASRTAISLAGGGAALILLLHPAQVGRHPLGSVVAFIAIVLLTVGFTVILHTARRKAWRSACASLGFGLRWLFSRHLDLFMPARAAEGGRFSRGSVADDRSPRS
jgi:hypothetical protein